MSEEKTKDLGFYFEDFINTKSLFKDKKVLQTAYSPDEIPHRENEHKQITQVIGPILRLERPSNLFIYGKTGCGKTLSVKKAKDKIEQIAQKNKLSLKIIYVNCKLRKVADTEYRLIAHLTREFGKEIPATGLPTEEIYNLFFSAVDLGPKITLIVLDEIDQLVKKVGDEMLYNLTRINEELKNSQVAIIGLSNDLMFSNSLDPRVKSSLSEEELYFPPYNALQLQDILNARAKAAFDTGVIGEGVVEKCAAYAAREHGDARRALELLRVSGEVAERNGDQSVTVEHVDIAEDKIEKDSILDVIAAQPKQAQSVLYAILQICIGRKKGMIFTGEIYELYKKISEQVNLRPLTQRRVSDIIAEFDMLGIINARVVSKGRYGRTREISIATPESVNILIQKALSEALVL